MLVYSRTRQASARTCLVLGVQSVSASLPDAPEPGLGCRRCYEGSRGQPRSSSPRTMLPIAHIRRTSSEATATFATFGLLPLLTSDL